MKKILTTFTISILSVLSYSQNIIIQELSNKIEIGYTTRWDIESIFGKGEYLQKQLLSPDLEKYSNDKHIPKRNSLSYSKLGLIFECLEDGELVSGLIQLRKPFKGILCFNDTIQIGKTKLEDIFPRIDTLKVSTSSASNYWSFEFNDYIFYIRKSEKHKDDYYFKSFEKNTFKDNLKYYKNQPVDVVTFFSSKNSIVKDTTINKNNKTCIKPLYAPKDETHLNCFEMGWPDKVPTLMRPLYFLTGGQKSKRIKQGYWKEYGSNHKLIYEGTFKENNEIGLFKYYNQDGKLIKVKTFSKSKNDWIYVVIIGIVISLMTVIFKKMKKNTT